MSGGLWRIRAGRAGDLAGPVVLLAILSFLVVAPVSRAEDEQERPSLPPPKTWHATAYVRGRIGLRVIDYWSQGPDMRARTLIAGHPITTLVRGDRYVVVDELTGRGVDIRRSKQALAADRRRTRPFAFELDELIADEEGHIDFLETQLDLPLASPVVERGLDRSVLLCGDRRRPGRIVEAG